MKVSLSIFICILFSSTILAQWQKPIRPYEQVEFNNLKPIWYQTIKLEEQVGDSCDGYNFIRYNNNFRPIVMGDHLLSSYPIKAIDDISTGAILLKRNLSDGGLVWQNFFRISDDTFTNRQEVVVNLSVSNQNIESYNFKRVLPYNTDDRMVYDGSHDMRLVKRTYNAETGKQVLALDTDLSNTKTAVLGNNHWKQLNFSTIDIIEPNKLEYNHYDYFKNRKKYGIVKFHIDTFGYQTGLSDTFFYPNHQKSYNFHRYNSSNYLAVNGTVDTTNRISLFFLDEHLKIKKKVASEKFDSLKQVFLHQVSDKYILLTSNYKSYMEPVYEVIKMDYDAKVIGRYKFPEDRSYSRYISVLDWESTDDIFIIAYTAFEDENKKYRIYLDVLKSNKEGGFDIVKRTDYKNRLRVALPISDIATKYKDNLIVEFEEHAYEEINEAKYIIKEDNNAKAHSIMMFSKEELGLKEKTFVADNAGSTVFKMYPNPVQDYLNVEINEDFNGHIILTDLNGKVAKEVKCNNSNFIGLNLTDLSKGIYFITISNHKQKILYRNKVVKI